VPFAKDSCFVSCVLQNLWKGDDIEVQMVAMTNGMGNAHLKGRAATHQGTPGGGAGRADMKVIKPCAFCPEGVQVGGTNAVIAHAGEITFTLIIG